jgi:hypothetical protein
MIEPEILWDPDGNVQHIAENDVSVEEVEEVLLNPRNATARSRRNGRPMTFGWTSTGRYIAVAWDIANDDPRMIYPVTAYEVPPPRR